MSDGKIIIAGTGRAGTTFLMQLLTRVGCDTGFTPYKEPYDKNIKAGCEWVYRVSHLQSDEEIRRTFKKSSRIIKAPDLSRGLKLLVGEGLVEIDHIILPIRDVKQAAMSRLEVGLDWQVRREYDYALKLDQQILMNYVVIGQVVEVCLLFQIPITVMNFHIFTHDEKYCYQKLSQAVDGIKRKKFGKVYKELLSERKNKKNG